MSAHSIMTVSPSKLDLRFKQLRTITELSIKSMVLSLEKRGQLTPIVTRDDGKRFILIDGFKRCEAAKILGLNLISITIPGEEPSVKAYMYLLNRKSGFTNIEEGMLVRELVEVDGFMQVEVATMMERHKSWVSRRLEMIRSLTPAIVEDLKLGLLPPGSAIALARLPQCNQPDLAAVIQTHKLQAKECGILIDLWCKAKNPEYRDYLIKFPKKAINLATGKEEREKTDTHIPAKVSKWLNMVRGLERVATLLHIKSNVQIGALDEKLHGILDRAVDQADSECRQAFRAARQLLLDSHHQDAHMTLNNPQPGTEVST